MQRTLELLQAYSMSRRWRGYIPGPGIQDTKVISRVTQLKYLQVELFIRTAYGASVCSRANRVLTALSRYLLSVCCL